MKSGAISNKLHFNRAYSLIIGSSLVTCPCIYIKHKS